MTYDSTINFTLDTICPWTYIAKKRLDMALEKVRAEDPPVNFTVHFHPYQLFADAPAQGEDKYEWYKREKYQGSEDQMAKFTAVMMNEGEGAGINFKFGGTIASTLNAHRVIQHFQEKYGEAMADRIVAALYRRYFEEERHPSSDDTLTEACVEAGVDEKEARAFVTDDSEGLGEVKMLIREQAMNGVDAVPFIQVEGKRRDFTLEGAKEVDEYVKALRQVIKEAT